MTLGSGGRRSIQGLNPASMSVKPDLRRKIGPHALRHYAAASILRQTGDLELVRQVLKHGSLAMTLRYAHLMKPDVSAKFQRGASNSSLLTCWSVSRWASLGRGRSHWMVHLGRHFQHPWPSLGSYWSWQGG